jgi:predicted DCC family thiol-disulfide oxidoreductase YuxK
MDSAPKPPVLLFDGVCNLCNGWVRFVIARERQPLLTFAPLESGIGRELLDAHQLDGPGRPDSLVLIEAGRAYVRSAAALRVTRQLRAPWSWARVLGVLPRPLLDWVYDRVARNRYRWFGRKDACPIPTPEERSRFLA